VHILALETSTEIRSAALYCDGATRSLQERGRARHGERLLPMIDRLLAEAGIAPRQLDAIGFGRGPGSFTGVRIAAGTVQGLACGCDLGVVPVSTLAALAQGAGGIRNGVLSAIDARMGELYWGAYRADAQGLMQAVDEDRLLASPAEAPVPDGSGWYGVGCGWKEHAEALRQRLQGRLQGWNGDCAPLAENLVPLILESCRRGKLQMPEQAIPVYLRARVAAPRRG